MTEPARRAARVLLIGLEAADWQIIRPLMAAGRLPNFTRLVESGLSGTMLPLSPAHAAPAWTSIATGKRAIDHGVYTAAVPAATGPRPLTPADRAAHPVWAIASSKALTSHCIAWPGVHATEPTSGICASEAFVSARDDQINQPVDLADQLRRLRLLPQQVQAATMRELVGDKAMARAGAGDARLRACAGLLAQAVTTHNVATALAADEWDLIAVHYAAIGQASGLFMTHRPPALPIVSAEDADAFGGVVDAVYEFQDLLLGRLLNVAGDEADVIMVSTHGYAVGQQRPTATFSDITEAEAAWHRGGGVCVLAGPSWRHDELIERVSPYDIAPTILSLLGIPFGSDMAGRPLGRAMKQPLRAPSLGSWETELPLPEGAVDVSSEAWRAADALVALDYTDAVAEQTPAGAEMYLLQLFHRAQSLFDAGQPASAVLLLRKLAAYRPTRRQYHIELFRATMATGDTAAARKQLEAAVAAGQGGSLAELGLAAIDLADHQPLAALHHLEKIDSANCGTPDVLVLKGEALLALGRKVEAVESYAAALILEPANEKAWIGCAKAHRGQGDLDRALDSISQAIAHRPDAAAAHTELAMIRHRRGELPEARRALLRALSIDPTCDPARRLLSRLQLAV